MIEQIFDKLREASEVEAHWEYNLAARFGLLGLALLTEEERTRFQSLKPYEPEANELLEKAASVAGRLVDKNSSSAQCRRNRFASKGYRREHRNYF